MFLKYYASIVDVNNPQYLCTSMQLERSNNWSHTWVRLAAGHIAGRGEQLEKGTAVHAAGRGGQLVIQLVIKLGEESTWSYTW